MRSWTHFKRLILLAALAAAAALLSSCAAQSVELKAPEGLAAYPDGDAVYVSWQPCDGANCYYVYRRASDETDYFYWGVTPYTELRDITVESGKQYAYRVFPAIKSSGAYRRGESGATSAYAAPIQTPQIYSLQTTETGCTLSWHDSGADRYILYRSDSRDGAYAPIAETDALTYTDREAADGTAQYFYKISSVVGEGAGFPSLRSEAVHTVTPPMPKLCLRQNGYTAAISWTPVAAAGDVQYRIYRRIGTAGTFRYIGQTSRSVYFDDGLERTDVPSYSIAAFWSDGKTRALSAHSPSIQAAAAPTSSVLAFMYHIVLTEENVADGMALSEYAIYASELESDLQYLSQNGYTTIDTRDLLAYIEGRRSLPEKAVILTIDDGSYSVYLNVFPLLKKYNMKAVLYVIGEMIDEATAYTGDRAVMPDPYCTWPEIAEMSASGLVDIESHSYYLHKYGTGESRRIGASIKENEDIRSYADAMRKDKQLIYARIEEVTGKEPVAFAYPFSRRSAEADDVLRYDVGIKLLMGIQGDLRTMYSYFLDGKGYDIQNTLIPRITRMRGTPIGEYIEEADAHDLEGAVMEITDRAGDLVPEAAADSPAIEETVPPIAAPLG